MKSFHLFTQTFPLILSLIISQLSMAADSVPTDVQLPGTQPAEIGNLESPNKCDNCHGGYNSAVEPAHNWRGSMMAQAGRDPIFWATVAIAEQDFDGVGDLCIRCHSTTGWLGGRSTPTDGSGLAAADSDGVDCDYCHKLTNPDDSQHQGEMTEPFVASEDGKGYYGSGMSSMWGGSDKLGPYDNAEARHQFMQSDFHRDRDFCGTCHDVSNPVTGDLAHNHGIPDSGGSVIASGVPGAPVDGKAAFNNLPHAYGVVERTFSEYKSGQISQTLVDDFPNISELPRGGVLEAIYMVSTDSGTRSANYENPPANRYFSCQTCHMRPVTGTGANKRGVPVRSDLPLHDLTGGNYWMPSVIEYLDLQDKLRLGGGMSPELVTAMNDGALRAKEQLELAATLEVEGNEVKVINHTGHKLITGYPEGRRMWLNIKWFDADNVLIHEDGKYGPLEGVFVNGINVQSLLDLDGENTRIWQAHMGMTKEWAQQLIDLQYPVELPLSFDRNSGLAAKPETVVTLGEFASSPANDMETFHFALNNVVIEDNRIPPYGMSYNIAKQRNALPVPAAQFGGGTTDSIYEHYDEVNLVVPAVGAARADISLMYQPTSWEYIQFLALANDGNNAFLGNEGNVMLDAWLKTGMAEPFVMTSAVWGTPTEPPCDTQPPVLSDVIADDKKVILNWSALADENVIAYSVYYDQAGKAQWVADSNCLSGQCEYTDLNLTNGQEYCYKLTTRLDSCESGFSAIQCATPRAPGQQQVAGVASLQTGKWVREGKGKNATQTFVLTSQFVQGDSIIFQAVIADGSGLPVSGAQFNLAISGPESTDVVGTSSDNSGMSEATWGTQAPNKKGVGGTAVGAYLATVNGLTTSGYNWDGVTVQVMFNIE